MSPRTSKQAMGREAVLDHWNAWASAYGDQLQATTRCETIKSLEIDAFSRWIVELGGDRPASVLELGCGNGINGIALTDRFPKLRYIGLDYSEGMVASAAETAARLEAEHSSRIAFGVTDVRELAAPLQLAQDGPHFAGAEAARELPVVDGVDFAITDRMLINLSDAGEQLDAIRRIASLVRPGGHFLMLENSVQTHATLNDLREALDLDRRPPAEFNVFIDDSVINSFAGEAELVAIDDFSAIHDLLLYAVQPALGDGEVEYDTPLMKTLTRALVELSGKNIERPGAFGQNRLWIWRVGESVRQSS